MSIITAASRPSVFRGLDYFEEKKVLSWSQIDDFKYEGYVSGSGKEPYFVTIDIEHPKRSVCNCPHAKGTRRVCKHKVALFFTVFPKEAEDFRKAIEEEKRRKEEEEEQLYDDIENYVNGLSVEQLRIQLINFMIELEEQDDDLWE
ncbi:MAG: SWIM zinc finger family protein [Peptostreptococcaceae bacterium]|nr:SWIM zinc finger family protein [Peptostreptococcaceae bacterium]